VAKNSNRLTVRLQRGEAAIVETVLILPLVCLVLGTLTVLSLWVADSAVIERVCQKYASLSAYETVSPGYYSVLEKTGDEPADTLSAVLFLEYEQSHSTDESTMLMYLSQKMQEEITEVSFLSSGVVSCKIEKDKSLTDCRIIVSVEKSFTENDMFSSVLKPIRITSEKRVIDAESKLNNGSFLKELTQDVVENSGKFKETAEKLYGRIFAK